tara:strand:+ start:28287 stop:30323 length:2037 start_codon:yes stop_codon:yes gene_type:complete
MNILLDKFETPFETTPFDKVKNSDFLPALKEAIDIAKKDIANLKNNSEKPTFNNVCEALEVIGKEVNKVGGVFFNLHSAESDDELQNLAKEFSPMMTDFYNDISLDTDLFNKVNEIYEQKDSLNLTQEEMMLLTKQYKSFTRNGANLNDKDKTKLREISKELSSLSLEFGDNVLGETKRYIKVIDDESLLSGLPEGIKEAAAMIAKEKGHEGKWAITLEYPSYVPATTYLDNRDLREELYRAFTSKASKGDDLDNQEIIKKIACLRHEKANLLGYSSHAEFVLEERMAEKPEKVEDFLKDLLEKAKPVAINEVEELKKFANETDGLDPKDFMPWDYSYYAEKLKLKKFNLDDEILKPYFKLENVIDGVFTVASKLYGLKFMQRRDIPVYHKDVMAYEVLDENDRHVSVFYADFFPREGKRAGAWMTSYRDQHLEGNSDVRPHVSIVCNFTKPTETKPSLLTFNEVTTLFHEFGHALHGMLSKVKYESLSGTSVYWDFVELPSQILENWAYEKECLDLFAKHYETNEKIPAEYIQRLKDSSNFHEGRATLRQISFALLDLSWHSGDPSKIKEVSKHEKEAMKNSEVLPTIDEAIMSCSFSHIFQGGYSAGYYSYKWAEVLDADAFEAFKEKGIFNKEVATSFHDNVLSKGGSSHPMELYKNFRGKEPTPEALLRRAGLV